MILIASFRKARLPPKDRRRPTSSSSSLILSACDDAVPPKALNDACESSSAARRATEDQARKEKIRAVRFLPPRKRVITFRTRERRATKSSHERKEARASLPFILARNFSNTCFFRLPSDSSTRDSEVTDFHLLRPAETLLFRARRVRDRSHFLVETCSFQLPRERATAMLSIFARKRDRIKRVCFASLTSSTQVAKIRIAHPLWPCAFVEAKLGADMTSPARRVTAGSDGR